jgi:uncharacterized repeat protein (TIGR01451 family)
VIPARSSTPRLRLLLLALVSFALLAAVAAEASPAQAAGSWWRLSSTSAPEILVPGQEAQIIASASNLGYEDASGPVTISDRLPAGLELVPGSVRGTRPSKTGSVARGAKNSALACKEAAPIISCTSTSAVAPYGLVELVATVRVKSSAAAEAQQNEVTLQAATVPAPLIRPLAVGSSATPFGVENYELKPENETGGLETQAGVHPFQLTTTLEMNQILKRDPAGVELTAGSPALLRDLHFVLPPGLLGNVNVLEKCSSIAFSTVIEGDVNLCPSNTAIGVARITFNEPNVYKGVATETVPVFNLEPSPGEPARFGFEFDKVPVALTTSVRTGKDYAVEVSATDLSQAAEVLTSQVTFWGQPGSPKHDAARGWECVEDEANKENELGHPCEPQGEAAAPPFLSLPTSCPVQAPVTNVTGRSWPIGEPHQEFAIGSEGAATFHFPALTGCELLGFEPSLSVEPDTHAASTPTGLDVKVATPQKSTLSPPGCVSRSEAPGACLAEADLKETVVQLPEGVLASPGAANGLATCAASSPVAPFGFGFFGEPEAAQLNNEDISPAAEECPDASKLGTITVKTPLLKNELRGSVYLASQDTTLLEERLVLYLTAYDPETGVRVKLAGDVHLDRATGRLTSTFKNTPQVPFEQLTIHFFDGPTSTQSTPSQCGAYTSLGAFVPWSGQAAAQASGAFSITEGPGGGPCPNPASFGPSFVAGPTSTQAGGFTSFSLTIGHSDADQPLSGLTVHLPAGAAAVLASLTPCPEPPAGQEWSCGADSQVGHSTSTSGLGGSPFSLGGTVYLTSGYGGAPFGLLVVTPANAGPFHLGNVNVRSRIFVDRNTAAVTIVSDPFPTFVRGVPVQLKQINVTIDRANFEFNPTNCAPLSVSATITGTQGGSAAASNPYGVTNCGALPFTPTLTASTKGNASKANGAELVIKVSSSHGQANIAKTKLVLPITLPSRLTTIQKACPDSTFEVNPATCDEGSNIGHAVVHTPVLKEALTGPAYLVSHGNAAFPDVEFVLSNKEGIELILDGQTDIKKGITTSTFNSVPDAPVESFEAVLPEGPHSALTSNVPESKNFSLCGAKLVIPTTITGQNGAVIQQNTKVPVEGCGAVKANKAKKLSRAQKLKKALKACKKKKSKSKRAACEKQARKKYGAKKSKKKPAAKKKK